MPEPGPRDRRKVPTVTEVVEAIVRGLGIAPERRGEVFRAAQQVCAEEMRLTRTGFAPAPLSELAERAVRLLPADMGGERVASRGWNEDAPFPEEALVETAFSAGPDDPFGDEPDAAPALEVFPAEREGRVVLHPSAGSVPSPEEPEAEEEENDEEIAFETVDRPEAAPRGGKLVAFLLVVAIAGGVWFFAKTRRVPPVPPAGATSEDGEPAAPGVPAPGSGGAVAPASDAGTSGSAARTTPEAPRPSPAAPPAAPAPAIPESRGSTMVSPDWTGAPVWMIHFSSYQRRENAERDAGRLSKVLGRPLRVIGINLGAPGLWYRVMLGDYGSREEAQAARDALAAKGIPGLGFVYRVERVPEPRAPAP